uniref:Helicase ATP-binding domain-containing protein n=1 Tax=Plectus sambesii TaxID=2011161 RepID=A0A914WSU3_9BILA
MVRKKVASSRLAADEQVAKSWSSGETNNNGLLIDNDEGEVSHNVELDEKYTEDAEDCESFQIDHARISVSVNLAPPIEEVCAHHLSYFELSFAGNDSATNNFRTFLEEDAVKLTIAWTSPELTLGECGWLIAAGKAVQVKVGRRARQNVERKYARIRFTDEQSLLLPALKKCSKLFALWSTFPASPHCIRIAVGVQRSAFDQDAIFGSQTAVDSINAVMAFFFGEQLRNIPRFETQEWFRESLEQFYASLKQHRKKVKAPLSNHDPQHADLVPLLRPYQREAVQWMIERENNPALPFGPWVLADKFARITPTNGEPFYYSPVVGSFLAEKPRHPTILPGGILADEMGLGKTVEVIAVMLNNPRDRQSISNQTSSDHHQDEVENVLNELISHVVATVDGRAGLRSPMRRDRKRMSAYICYDAPKEAPSTSKRRRTAPAHSVAEVQCISCKKWSIREKVGWNLFASDDELYTCPTCVVAQDPIPGKATLIVSPSTICHQWYEELKRHVGGRRDFKIDVYRGLSVDGFKHPLYLAQCDVVICSYETLRGELNFVNLNERMTLRRPKVYRIAPSPLTAVNFWRICLDEAQMVESSSSQAAAMCLELNAVNRWCVTGTPIHKSIGELHGLITFLGVEPYYVKAWWERMIWLPYINKDWTPLLDLMARILWRNTKADVHDQLNIPAQLERTTWLQFSPIEEQFYRQTADVCSVNAARVFSRYDDYSLKLFELSRQAVDELMRPLLSLRRCTVHPTIRNNGRLVLTGVKRNITQAELLEEMVKSTKRECEESHRRIVLGLNGLAGCAWLVGEMASAADYYRQALRSIKEHEEAKKFRTDPLQQIHAMHNLMELLKREQGGVPAACADDQLPDQLAARRQQYLSESCTAFRNASNKLSAIEEKRLVKEEQFGECEGWVAEQVSQAERHQIDGEMTAFVRQTLMEKQGNLPNIKLIFRNGRGLSLAADNRWQELKSGREQLAVAVKEMEGFDFDCEELLHTVVTCHLRPFGGLEHILHR